MSRTYKATGIILKGMPLGEADRLVTILTPEYGLIRAIAPGARKPHSRLRGRSELFVVNDLLLAKGRSLDKITQAETLESYAGLSKDLGKLAASQYLAELALCIGLSEQPQEELYELLNEHLRRFEKLSSPTASEILAHLSQAVFHLLALAGVGLQVHSCGITKRPLLPNFTNPHWRVGFSADVGGMVNLAEMASEKASKTAVIPEEGISINSLLSAIELTLLQQLALPELPKLERILPKELLGPSVDQAWIKVERLLRNSVEYHFNRSIRSAALVDTLTVSF
ncbi:MAG: DNA repair protein RecO [Chroococcales cyanobacterium]